MGATKISEKELREELEAGMTKEEIMEKHGVTIHTVNRKMKILGLREEAAKMEGELAADCFAHDRFNGSCSCLSVKTCPGKSCPFYKEAGVALEESKRSLDSSGVYQKSVLEVIAMIERNQEISA